MNSFGIPWPKEEKTSHTKWSEYKRKREMNPKHAMQGQLTIHVGSTLQGGYSVASELHKVPNGAVITAMVDGPEQGSTVIYWSKEA